MNPNGVKKPEQIKLIMECARADSPIISGARNKAPIPEPFTTGSAS